MKICIVAHHARRKQAERLATDLDAHVIMDEVGLGALWGHRKALEWAAQAVEPVIVMEDDALPVEGFRSKAESWLTRLPDELISFYLGTGRPPQYQGQIEHLLRRAEQGSGTHISLPQLIHGVCYSVPDRMIAAVLSKLPARGASDFAIGNAWRQLTCRSVIYPVRSLVDHDDGPSVEVHPDGQARTEPRRAWQLEGVNGR